MRMVKKPQAWLLRLLPAAAVLLPVGCSSMSGTDKGLLAGGAIGTGAGALIGHATGHTGAGAVIGSITGAAVGGLAGAASDEHKHEQAVRQAQAQRGPLGLEQIAEMARSGVGDAVIIEQIRVSGYVYRLTADQITWLHQAGVSDVVIQTMLRTEYGRVVFTPPPPPPVVYGPPPVVVVEPPPPRVGVGVTVIGGGCRRW
jgi:hypothetical protein